LIHFETKSPGAVSIRDSAFDSLKETTGVQLLTVL